MSAVERRTDWAGRLLRGGTLAVAGLTALTWAYASVLWRVTDVVGGGQQFLGVLVASFGLALLVGRFVGVRAAVGLASALFGLGLAGYLLALPQSQLQLLTPRRALADTVALLTGLSILRLVGAGVWATAVLPGPVFLSWYLAVRRRYVAAAVAGGLALGLVVLTGDADGVTTLVGVLGATATVAAATFERHGVDVGGLDALTVVLAAMVVASATLTVVPGAAGSPILPDRGSPTVEANLVESRDRVEIVGSIRLSPKIRFTVESPRPQYWQTGAYDRYTGDGWVRTGTTRPYEGPLRGPPGPTDPLEQTVTARDSMSVLPAAWRPISLDGAVSERAVVTPQGTLRPGGTLQSGDRYTVRSRVPQASPERLRAAGTDYPDRVTDSYLQLPSSTTQRVRERAASVTADAETPYAEAVAIERYLESNKEYSLSVPPPSGDVVDTFLFERDAGYCTYFATAMVVMLRSEGVPARFVTGYTSGEQTGDGEYVVRGLNSHAWVEVYFPEVGWVRFDPTPGGPRETAEEARLTEARQSGETNVDLPGPNGTVTPPVGAPAGATTPQLPAGATPGASNATPGTPNATPTQAGSSPASDSGSGPLPVPLPSLPSRRMLLIGAVALVGLTAGARRTGTAGRMRRLLAVQYQRRRDPETDVARAYRRVATVLERRHRPRRPGETPRAYFRSLPDGHGGAAEARRVGDLYERARYGGGVDRDDADEAVALADELVRSATPVLRWFRSRS
ncbi:transglutaminaseTgpA domain-containing protein [Halobellus sp. EA9]|uniref:transglutaminase TgpA family protein n=1 Tax=Halobellus sp. EA9 TaxID=3421647 RepID=UPI003EB7BC77